MVPQGFSNVMGPIIARARSSHAIVSTFAAGIATRLLIFVMTILVARHLSPEGYGQFTFATGCAMLIAQTAGLGWPMLMSRLIPSFRAQSDWSSLRSLLRWGDIVVLSAAVVATAIVASLSLFPGARSEIAIGLGMALVLIIPSAINLARRSQLAGARRPALGILLDEGVPPLILIAALVIGVVADARHAVILLAISTALAAAAATVALWRATPREVWAAPAQGQPSVWMGMAFPLLLGLLSKLVMDRMDILMLGPLAGFEETGYYGSAYRLTYLVTFPQVMLMTVMTPMLSEMHASGRLAAMWRAFGLSSIFALATSVPASLLLFIFSDEIMTLAYGAQYAPAGSTLQVLAIVQTLTALSIPCASLLIANGQGRSYGVFSLLGLAVNAGLNLVLIDAMGAAGAALASLAGAALIFSGQGWQILKLYRTSNMKD